MQVNHADIAQLCHALQPGLREPAIAQPEALTAAGRAALDGVITQQAPIIAYIDDFKLMMILALAAMPLLLVFKKPGAGGGLDHAVAME